MITPTIVCKGTRFEALAERVFVLAGSHRLHSPCPSRNTFLVGPTTSSPRGRLTPMRGFGMGDFVRGTPAGGDPVRLGVSLGCWLKLKRKTKAETQERQRTLKARTRCTTYRWRRLLRGGVSYSCLGNDAESERLQQHVFVCWFFVSSHSSYLMVHDHWLLPVGVGCVGCSHSPCFIPPASLFV